MAADATVMFTKEVITQFKGAMVIMQQRWHV